MASHNYSGVVRMETSNTYIGRAAILLLSCCFKLRLDLTERRHQRLSVSVDLAIVDQPDRDRVQVVELLAADLARCHESGLLQDAQVLHDTGARHVEVGVQLGERLTVALE